MAKETGRMMIETILTPILLKVTSPLVMKEAGNKVLVARLEQQQQQQERIRRVGQVVSNRLLDE